LANEFGKVHVGIVASTGGLVAGLNTASTSLQKFGVMAKGAAGGATAGGFQALSTGILGTGVAAKIASFGVKSLTAAFGPLLAVMVVIRAITSIFGALAASTKRAEEVHKLSQALGISAKSYQALAHAAGLAEVEQGTLNKSFLQMQNNLGKLANGSPTVAKAFATIGLSARSFIGLNAEQSFLKIAKSISELGTQAQKTAAAAAMFGKGGKEMLNFLQSINKDLPETKKFLVAMGVALDDLETAKIEEMGDALGQLDLPAQGFANLFNKEIAPAVTAASKNLIEFSKTSKDGFSAATVLGQGTAFVIKELVRGFNMLNALAKGLKGVWILLIGAGTKGFGFIVTIVGDMAGLFGGLLTTIENIGRSIINSMITPLKNLLLLMARAAEATGMTGLAKNLRDSAESMTKLGTASGKFGEWVGSFGNSFSEWGEQFMRAGEGIARTALDVFAEAAQQLFDPLAFFNKSVADSGKLGAAAAEDLKKGGEAAAKAIKASASELKAIIVDSAAGETFRNDLVRGADPRLNEDHLKGIEANTEESASILSRIDSKFSPTGIAFLTA
jgi:hypothetical protein